MPEDQHARHERIERLVRSLEASDSQSNGTTEKTKAMQCKEIAVSAEKHLAINVVLVPSGFKAYCLKIGSSDPNCHLNYWQTVANYIADSIQKYDVYNASNIAGLNFWYLDKHVESDLGNLCGYSTLGAMDATATRKELMDCPSHKDLFRALARTHCGAGSRTKIFTLVVHADTAYGGGGYPDVALAVISLDQRAVGLAAHEMAHGIFGLSDEYSTSFSTAELAPNCDVEGCPKWRDLQDSMGVACQAGKCLNQGLFASGLTIMGDIRAPNGFGAANERIICCVYRHYTSSTPQFCGKFTDKKATLDLDTFCQGNLWKGKFFELSALAEP